MIYCIGEITYDIVFKDNKPVDGIVGGSQLNTAISLGRLGQSVSLVSQTSTDQLGQHCLLFLQQNAVNTQYINSYKDPMRLAVAFLDDNSNANYSFYKPTESTPLNFPKAKAGDYVLFGSSFALRSDIRKDLLAFLHQAKKDGALILYDPNCRKTISPTSNAFSYISENFSLAHIIKASDEDFVNLGASNFHSALQLVQSISDAPLVYTMGSKGVKVHCQGDLLKFDAEAIQAISTIGAGDTFSAGLLFGLVQQGINPNTMAKFNQWQSLIGLASRFAQTVCMSRENYLPKGFVV